MTRARSDSAVSDSVVPCVVRETRGGKDPRAACGATAGVTHPDPRSGRGVSAAGAVRIGLGDPKGDDAEFQREPCGVGAFSGVDNLSERMNNEVCLAHGAHLSLLGVASFST